MLQRCAFKMFRPTLKNRRRHDAIWPEFSALLRNVGVSNYSIHLDAATILLFPYLERRAAYTTDALPSHPEMRRWWDHKTNIMRANPDDSPVAVELQEMFYLA